mgnify:CR=1 FL=1
MLDVAGRKVLSAEAEQTHVDTNIGGLEVYVYSELARTFCVVGQASKPTRCALRAPLAIRRSYDLGFVGEVEADSQEIAASIRASAYHKRVTLSADVRDDGTVEVEHRAGDAALIGPGILGPHELW